MSPSTLTPGTRLGPYEILSALGAGGMGEVYRATDTNLKRQVAIKVLPAALTADHDRLARFQREAEVLASLNHPHIAAIYGLEDTGGVRALVMELVEGPTLADRIAHGAIPLDEALPIARQIAEALEAAHERGIIHRDLKPANIKVRPDGTVKVLDFGLAKALDPRTSSMVDMTQSPTITNPAQMTAAGIILGTAAYMSPEQAAGKAVDKRSDLWSFGAVLLEMLSGEPVFRGETVSHVLASVLKDAPDWGKLPANTPAPIRRLLRRCLEKDRKRRLDSASDVRLEIDDALTAPAEAMPVDRRRRIVPFVIASVLVTALVATLAMWVWMRPASPLPAPLTRFMITTPSALPLAVSGIWRDVAVAPDGSFVVYVAGRLGQLVVRRFDRLDAAPLAGVTNAAMPFVSPDSRWIGYFENTTTLKKVALSGGAPITLAQMPGLLDASWVDEATIVVGTINDPMRGLLRVPAGGGEPTVLTTPDRAHGEVGHVHPSGLPGGRAVLFTIEGAQLGKGQTALLDLQTGQRTTLLRRGGDAQYVASGHLVYGVDGALYAVRFDLARRTVVGDPVPIAEDVSVVSTGSVNAAVGKTGTLVYVPGEATGLTTPRSLVWVDRQGHETPIPAPPRAYMSPRLSPDGTRVAVEIRDQELDVWVLDLARQTLTRLTSDPYFDRSPVWTGDGRRIVFSSDRTGAFNLYARAADTTGEDVRLTTSPNTQLAASVTPDGAFVIGVELRPQTGRDLVRLALDGQTGGHGPGAAGVDGLIETPFDEGSGEVSPDGRFLAYQSNESGRYEIYVSPYPQVTTKRWPVSTGGGTQPAWTRGGRELVYLDGANHLTAVPVETTGSTFRPGTPTPLFTTAYATPSTTVRTYDVSLDGQRFLMIKEGAGGTGTVPPPSLVVVEHWFEELTRLVPTK